MSMLPPRRRALLAATLALSISPAWSQGFPSKPVTLVVPYPAGGGADALARALQPTLARVLGQAVVVENVGGAGGSLGVLKALSAPADGHTLLVGSPNEVILAPLALQAAKYRSDDLKMLAPISDNPLVLMARKDLAATSFDELVALARQQRDRPISFGSIGHGSMYHIVAEYLGLLSQVPLVHVPYKGTAPLVQDLAGQQVDFAVLPNVGTPTQLLESGRIKALAVLDRKPMATLPHTAPIVQAKTPRAAEAQYSVWAAVLVRKDVSEEHTRVLHRAVQEAIASGDVAKALEPSGVKAMPPHTLEESASLLRSETAKFQALARSIKLGPL